MFEEDEGSSKDIMFYDNISYYVEREYNNKDGHLCNFRKVTIHSLISGKRQERKRRHN